MILICLFLSSLSYIGIYYISKTQVTCIPNCKNKICGESDNCGSKCKFCQSDYNCVNNTCIKQNNLRNDYQKDISKYKGICYFDIDGTLNDSLDNTEDMMKECLNNDFDIGIVTASNRTLKHICDENNNPKELGIPRNLCEHLNKNKGVTFNSLLEITGDKNIPSDYPSTEHYGIGKAFSMIKGRDKLHPDIPDKCIVLFDNDPHVLNKVINYPNHDLQVQCAGYPCSSSKTLSTKLVKDKLNKMISNGCK